MKKKKLLKREKGITLIALVVTIIVLLILAGVSITLLIGEDGILNKAQGAGEENIKGTEKEQIALAWNEACLDKYAGKIEKIDAIAIETNLKSDGANAKAEDLENQIIVTFLDTEHVYFIDADGNITGGIYNLQKSPTAGDITIEAVETSDYSVTLKITQSESFSGYELQYKTDSSSWTKYTTTIEITENTTVYARLYNSSTGASVEKSFVVENIQCLHSFSYGDEIYHECIYCGESYPHSYDESDENYHYCSVCDYTEPHSWCTGVDGNHWCTTCDYSEAHSYVFTNESFHECSVCGENESHCFSDSWDGTHVCMGCYYNEAHYFHDVGDGNHYCGACGRLELHSMLVDSFGNRYCEFCDYTEWYDTDEGEYTEE